MSGWEWGVDDRHTGGVNVAFLDGHAKFMKPDAFYREANCELILGETATALDRAARRVTLSDDSSRLQ